MLSNLWQTVSEWFKDRFVTRTCAVCSHTQGAHGHYRSTSSPAECGTRNCRCNQYMPPSWHSERVSV